MVTHYTCAPRIHSFLFFLSLFRLFSLLSLSCLVYTSTVPAAAGNSKRQIKFISYFKTTALHAIPSYAIRLAEVFQEEGIDPRETTLKTLVDVYKRQEYDTTRNSPQSIWNKFFIIIRFGYGTS